MYHLPLLPGYGPNSNIRSSVPSKTLPGKSLQSHLSEAEEAGYQGSYFPAERATSSHNDGYITSSPPQTRKPHFSPASPDGPFSPLEQTPPMGITPSLQSTPSEDEIADETETETENYAQRQSRRQAAAVPPDDDVAEVVFFEYGVVVFFGLLEGQEKGILEDVDAAGIMSRKIEEADWEIEECHFTVSLNSSNSISPLTTEYSMIR